MAAQAKKQARASLAQAKKKIIIKAVLSIVKYDPKNAYKRIFNPGSDLCDLLQLVRMHFFSKIVVSRGRGLISKSVS